MIYLPKIYGTCCGAQNALDVVYKVYNKEIKKAKPKRIVVLKEILHNHRVIEDLNKKNIVCVNDLKEIKKDDIVIIRAHGEGKITYDYLKDNNIEYYDATCKNVLHVHDIIKEKYYQNYEIIIIGKRNIDGTYHPEVEGSNGWCCNNAIIIDSLDDINNLKIKGDNVLIVCQTTYSEENANLFVQKIKEKYKDKNIEFINTICSAQKLIQKSAIKLAKTCDYMIVVGGKNSSNTTELYNVCSNITKSIKVSSLEELLMNLNKIEFLNSKIGITGGASTPKYEIEEYKSLLEFYTFYKKEKEVFELEIEKYNNNYKEEKDNLIVKDAIEKFININCGGKYLRATLIALGYKIFSKCDDQKYLPLSIAYETFQTSILIHDDIIDNAIKRRGKDTIPTTYKKEFTNNYIGDKVANDLGICLGDLGFYLANKIIINSYSKNTNILNVLDYYNNVVIKTIKGEIIDIKLPYDIKYEGKNCTEKAINEIYRLKTSWYTIVGPFCLGAILAGKNQYNLKIYEKILEKIGIAFQIKDDIIGIYGDSSYIGKSTSSDISEFKQTILYSYIFNQKNEYLEELNKYYGKENLIENENKKVKQIFMESGALNYANEIMNNLFDESIELIKNIDLQQEYKEIILGFIYYLKIRQK